jgi:enoyl-CoA hydratase/carnithine racemase
LYLTTTGARITAEQAFAWGLLEEIVPREAFEMRWRELATQIASAPLPVLVSIKATATAPRPVTPELAEVAIGHFARAWVADDHWSAFERVRAQGRR